MVNNRKNRVFSAALVDALRAKGQRKGKAPTSMGYKWETFKPNFRFIRRNSHRTIKRPDPVVVAEHDVPWG